MCSLIRALEMMEQIGEICFVSREIDTSIAKVALPTLKIGFGKVRTEKSLSPTDSTKRIEMYGRHQQMEQKGDAHAAERGEKILFMNPCHADGRSQRGRE